MFRIAPWRSVATPKIELLKSGAALRGCSKTELRQLAGTADEIDLREGTVLTREGRPGREFFVLIEGTARVTQEGQEDRAISARATGSARSPCSRTARAPPRSRRRRPSTCSSSPTALPLARRDDAVDRDEGARVRRRPARRATRRASAAPARRGQASAASPRSARTSAKKSASGFTRYSGPSASVRSPSDVSSAT